MNFFTKENQSHKLWSPEKKGVGQGEKSCFSLTQGGLYYKKKPPGNHCEHRNPIQHSVISCTGEEQGKEHMYIYVSMNLVAVDPKWKKKKKPTPQPCHSTIYSN